MFQVGMLSSDQLFCLIRLNRVPFCVRLFMSSQHQCLALAARTWIGWCLDRVLPSIWAENLVFAVVKTSLVGEFEHTHYEY